MSVKKIYRKSLIEGVAGCVEVTVLVSRYLKSGQVRTIQETGVVCGHDLGTMRQRLINRAEQSAHFKGASKLLNKNLNTERGRTEVYEEVLIKQNIKTQIIDIRFYYTVNTSTTIKAETINGKRYNVVRENGEILDKQRMRYFRDPQNYIEEDKTYENMG